MSRFSPDRLGDAEASVARGILAGAIVFLIALPVTPVTLLIATIMKQTIYRKVMHVSILYSDLQRHGREALIADALVAGATGLIAASIATALALKLVRHGRRSAFIATAAVALTLLAVVVWRAATLHGDQAGSRTLAVIVAWLLALIGVYLTEMTLASSPTRRRGVTV